MNSVVYKQFETIKSKLARSMKEILTKEAVMPSGESPVRCDVTIPYPQLDADPEDEGYAQATVIYVTYCPTEKKHVVRIKFQYDKTGKFLKDTVVYV